MHIFFRAAVFFICTSVPALAQDAESGGELYQRHCATCHGIEASGQGPMSGVLLIRPADLTGLSASDDGVFQLCVL